MTPDQFQNFSDAILLNWVACFLAGFFGAACYHALGAFAYRFAAHVEARSHLSFIRWVRRMRAEGKLPKKHGRGE